MKKNIFKTLVISLTLAVLSSSITIQIAEAKFSDVKIAHPNHEAITYLEEEGILNGYPDGSFQPNNSVSRVEFLKIVIEGSKVEKITDIQTYFTDLDPNDWYIDYVKTAYAKEWILGYQDKTFKPHQTISKAEALTILAKAQNWKLTENITENPFDDVDLTSWYLQYVEYAKKHSFIEETGNIFEPNKEMTRAKISEIIYRTIKLSQGIDEQIPREDTENTEEDNQTEETTHNYNDFTAVSPELISSTFFDDIELKTELPNTFYLNEVYILKGKVKNNSEVTKVVIDGITDSTFRSILENDTDNSDFEITLSFEKTGNYQLGILAGDSGTSSAKQISVLEEISVNDTLTTAPESQNTSTISFSNDKTYIEVNGQGTKHLHEFTFTQENNKKTYINRQDIDQIPLAYKDFEDFSEGTVSFSVESSIYDGDATITRTSEISDKIEKNFTATTHQYSLIDRENTNAEPPDILSSHNQNISFFGNTETNISKTGYVITPDGIVETFDLITNSDTHEYYGNEIINAGGNFTFTYNPTQNGTYIVEINNKEGLAIINHPVYIGDKIPLIPDYFDKTDRKLFSGTLDLQIERQKLVDLINQERQKQNLQEVELSSELNSKIAQTHADDMAENNYFAHVNLQGKSPSDRRVDAGITTAVGENIAKDTNLMMVHLGLMRSATHRQNILDPDWKRVGIGIAELDGFLIISEEFSTNEITEADLQDFKNELFNAINDERAKINLNPLNKLDNIDSSCTEINTKLINNETVDSNAFESILTSNNVTGNSHALMQSFNIWNDILDSILIDSKDSITDSSFTNIGIDIQKNSEGLMYTTVILNN